MKKLSNERLKEKLNEWFETVADYGSEEDKQAYQQIRQLIENQSEISISLIKKYQSKFMMLGGRSDLMTESNLIKMLQELGIEIVKK